MIRLRTVAAIMLAAGLIAAPLSPASAHRHGPFFLWPFVAAGAVVAGAAAIATAPFAAVAPPAPYYAPPPAYYAPPPGYYYPQGYYGR